MLRNWREGRLGVHPKAAARTLQSGRAASEVCHRKTVAQQEIRTGHRRQILARETKIHKR